MTKEIDWGEPKLIIPDGKKKRKSRESLKFKNEEGFRRKNCRMKTAKTHKHQGGGNKKRYLHKSKTIDKGGRGKKSGRGGWWGCIKEEAEKS